MLDGVVLLLAVVPGWTCAALGHRCDPLSLLRARKEDHTGGGGGANYKARAFFAALTELPRADVLCRVGFVFFLLNTLGLAPGSNVVAAGR